MRLGDHVIDLCALHALDMLGDLSLSVDALAAPMLNPLDEARQAEQWLCVNDCKR